MTEYNIKVDNRDVCDTRITFQKKFGRRQARIRDWAGIIYHFANINLQHINHNNS